MFQSGSICVGLNCGMGSELFLYCVCRRTRHAPLKIDGPQETARQCCTGETRRVVILTLPPTSAWRVRWGRLRGRIASLTTKPVCHGKARSRPLQVGGSHRCEGGYPAKLGQETVITYRPDHHDPYGDPSLIPLGPVKTDGMASIERLLSNGGHTARECEGGDCTAVLERRIPDCGQRTRQGEVGELAAISERSGAYFRYPCRHDNRVNTTSVSTYAGNDRAGAL